MGALPVPVSVAPICADARPLREDPLSTPSRPSEGPFTAIRLSVKLWAGCRRLFATRRGFSVRALIAGPLTPPPADIPLNGSRPLSAKRPARLAGRFRRLAGEASEAITRGRAAR